MGNVDKAESEVASMIFDSFPLPSPQVLAARGFTMDASSCSRLQASCTPRQPLISPSSACEKCRRAQLLCCHNDCVYSALRVRLRQAYSLSIIPAINTTRPLTTPPRAHLHLSFLYISLTLARR